MMKKFLIDDGMLDPFDRDPKLMIDPESEDIDDYRVDSAEYYDDFASFWCYTEYNAYAKKVQEELDREAQR